MVSFLSISNTQVIWQTGKKSYNAYIHHENETTRVFPFIDDMANTYAASDLVMSRSGAITCSELTVCGKPSILIPFPAAAADHQTKNADALARHGAAELVNESDIIPEKLAAMIQSLLNNQNQLNAMASASKKLGRPNSTSEIVDQAMDLIQ